MAADSGTYDQATILRRQKIAEAMLGDAIKPRKIEHWAQGLAQLGQAGIGGYLANQANEESKSAKAADTAALAALLTGGGAPPAATPAAAPAAPPTSNPVVTAMSGAPDYGKAISAIESGGSYDKLGPVTRTGDRAYGKYQVMGNNIPEWSKAVTGQAMTPEQFLRSPEAQEAIFKNRFGSYVDKYGPEGAAKAWFAGEKGMNNPNAKDMLGTTVEGYGKKFMAGLGPEAPQAPVAQAMAPPQMPASQPAGSGLLASATPQQRAAIAAGLAANEGSPARAIAMSMISNLTKAEGPTNDIREFEYGLRNPAFAKRQEDLKAAGRTQINNNVGGGSDKQIFDTMDESAKAARTTAIGLSGLREARNAITGGAVTGAGADFNLALRKAGSLIGVGDPNKIVNTETFRAAIAPQIASMLKSTVGTTNISNTDREFAEKAAGGNINLDEKSITRLLDIMERASVAQLEGHQKRLEAVYGDPEKYKRERALFGVEMPAAPAMPTQAAPAAVAGPPDRAAIEQEMRRRGLLK